MYDKWWFLGLQGQTGDRGPYGFPGDHGLNGEKGESGADGIPVSWIFHCNSMNSWQL